VKSVTGEMNLLTTDAGIDAAALKMKKIMARRHLLDSAKAQAEEADFLRQELDRMRQRTFPSFVKTTKSRLPGQNYPDDR